MEDMIIRQLLAGLQKSTNIIGGMEKETVRNQLSSWISFLPKYFGDELDRKTLWKRIRNGIRTAAQEAPNGDLYRFWTIVSNYICAKENIIEDITLKNIIVTFEKGDKNLCYEWFRQCLEETDILLAFAQEKWNNIKKQK